MFTILFASFIPDFIGVGIVVGLIVDLLVYFLPTLVAWNKKHHATGAVFVINLLFGWTLIGWVVALIWACTVRQAPVIIVQQAVTNNLEGVK